LGLPKDTAVDLALAAVPSGIVGARLYYVILQWEAFAANPISALYIWQGGLAIYGAVIGGAIGVGIYAWRKKLSFAALADLIAPGLLLAQAIGRWGNYFNMEAYGVEITEPMLQFFPFAVMIPSATGYTWHAATFFYESMWCLCGFVLLWRLRRRQTEKGNVFAWYLLIYGAGRFVIEQLRTDSLLVGNMRASQYLSLLLCTGAALMLAWRVCGRNMKAFAPVGACCLLWVLRWMAVEQHMVYALLLVFAGGLACWLMRRNKKALLCLTVVILLDGVGLLAAVLQPISAQFALWLHALICSMTLVGGVMVLCTSNK
ncbi:MAG: prolipoprotein diacylglyceryl transferase, partial [Clostridia bacterium]|nr:prolipoprotein diacylglyceryl transferase [Clostridia bacterium]